jgi:hypothetical protein
MNTLVKETTAKKLTRTRESIATEIEQTLLNFKGSIMELENKFRYKLGGQFRYLRSTFADDKKGSVAFHTYCEERFEINRTQRRSYMEYHERSGGELPVCAQTDDEPPNDLRPFTRLVHGGRKPEPRKRYTQIVDKETVNRARFDVAIQKREKENQLVIELAQKIISVGYRSLSVKLHPDSGGSNEAQKRLSAAKKMLQDGLLRESLRR